MTTTSDVCLSHTSGLSREQRGLEIAHVTRDSDTTFKVKKSTCRGLGNIVLASRTAYYYTEFQTLPALVDRNIWEKLNNAT